MEGRLTRLSVAFVGSSPILLGGLVSTTEYGRVLQMRTVLANSGSDATRYLARAPLNAEGNGYSPEVIRFAQALITSRINTNDINVGLPVISDLTARTSSREYRTVSLSAAVGVVTPALSVLALAAVEPEIQQEGGAIPISEVEGFVLVATETARYFGR